MNLNNRGQSLVLFVIMLPIMLLIMILVIDIGRVWVRKQELSNISEIVLDYGLNNLELEDIDIQMKELVKLNDDSVKKINIIIDKERISIVLNDEVSGIFSKFIDISLFKVEISYVGYWEDESKRIERMVGD